MRAIKNLFVFLLLLAVLAGGAVVGLRVARGRPSTPDQVKTNVVAASAAGIYVYAARVGDGGPVILFDAGADPEGRAVDAALGALHASRGDVTDIFLTHAHGDHTAAAPAFPNAKIHLGAADVPLAEKKVAPDAIAAKIALKIMDPPAVTVNAPLEGSPAFELGKSTPPATVKALPMPGHTPGSYAFLYDGVLFVGDAMVFKQGRLDRTPKYFDSDTDAARTALVGLKKQLADTDVDIVCTGHGGCTPKGLGKNLLDELISRQGA
jgi:glyoxylase-like metal-dependent hydrolase (beta-lactamase superfamily II)